MDEILTTVAQQIPALAALIFLVVRAMGNLRERDREFMDWLKKRDDQFTQALRDIGSECHAVQRRATEALDANTLMIGRMEAYLRETNGKHL